MAAEHDIAARAAHALDLHGNTLKALKRLIDLVQDGGAGCRSSSSAIRTHRGHRSMGLKTMSQRLVGKGFERVERGAGSGFPIAIASPDETG